VVCEVAGVLAGVAVGWQLFSGGFREKNVSKQSENTKKSD
jgi:hypothetical protein